jgi:hypothetical protein
MLMLRSLLFKRRIKDEEEWEKRLWGYFTEQKLSTAVLLRHRAGHLSSKNRILIHFMNIV